MDIKIKLENDYSIDFTIKNERIVNTIKENNAFKGGQIILQIPKVDDVYRYKIEYNDCKVYKISGNKDEENFRNSKFDDKTTDKDNELKTIVLLLESPHEHEYDSNNMPKAPAQGTTGDNIEKYITSVIKELIDLDEKVFDECVYRLIISNPIQYQASLFMYHNKKLKDEYSTLRNQVWREIWKVNEIKKDFKDRMDLYKPSLIINACTYSLQKKVTDYLLSEKYSNIYTTYHPSYWNGFNIKKQK